MIIFSVFAVFRGYRDESEELSVYVLGGGEASAIVTFGSKFKRLVQYCEGAVKSLFEFDEKEFVLYPIFRSKTGIFEVSLIYEGCGFKSSSESSLVMNEEKDVLGQSTAAEGEDGSRGEIGDAVL